MSSIYISKLDECTTENTLISHFSKYGFINDIQLSKLPDGRCKGYAKIMTKDASAYRVILNSEHVINGIKVKVEPFIEGEAEILAKDIQMVKRRVCVFGVPKNFDDKKFRAVFDYELGDVENAYVRRNKAKKFNYGFVTFNTEETALKALAMKVVRIRPGKKASRRSGDVCPTMQIKEFKSKGLMRRRKKIEGRDSGKLYFNNNYLNFYGGPLMQAMLNMASHNPHPAKARGGATIYPNNQVLAKNLPPSSTLLGKELNRPDIFMNPERLKDYVRSILDQNPQIKKLDQNEVRSLELFYFNKRAASGKKHTTYNYDSIATRFARRIDKNHYPENLVLRSAGQAPSRSEQTGSRNPNVFRYFESNLKGFQNFQDSWGKQQRLGDPRF